MLLTKVPSALIAVLILVAASTATATNPPPIVGLGYVGMGVDVTSMTFGLGQIMQLQYGAAVGGTTWINNVTKKTYSVPGGMYAQSRPFSDFTNSTTTFNGIEDYQLWAEHHYHWHSGFLGMVSHSKTTYKFLERLYTQDQSLAQSSLELGFLELTAPLLPPPPLTDEFQLAVNLLPKSFSAPADYHKFEEFFQSYGTAFMDSAYLGGRMMANNWFAKCLLNVQSKSWVTQQSGWHFLNIIGSGHGTSTHKYTIDGKFADCVESNVTYHGGNYTDNTKPDYWRTWAESVFDDPYPVSFTLQPIHMLVMDPTKSSVIEQALGLYLKNAQAALNATEAKMAKNDPHHKPACCRP